MLQADANIKLMETSIEDYRGAGNQEIVIFDRYVPENLSGGEYYFPEPCRRIAVYAGYRKEAGKAGCV